MNISKCTTTIDKIQYRFLYREYEANEIEGSREDLYTVSDKDLDAITEVEEEEKGTVENMAAVKPVEVEGRRWRLRRSRRISFEAESPWIKRRAAASSNFPPQMKKRNRKWVPFQIEPILKSSFPEVSSLGAKSQMKARRKRVLLDSRTVSKQMYRGSSFNQGGGNHVKVHVELNPRALENMLDDFDQDCVNTSRNSARTVDDLVNNCLTGSEENCRIDQKPKNNSYRESAVTENIAICPREYRSSRSNVELSGLRKRTVYESEDENTSDEEVTLDSILASWGAV